MSNNPFSSLTARYDFGSNTCTVKWELDGEYEDSSFIVRKSPDGERNIQLLKSDLGELERSYTDEDFVIGNRTGKLYYQVILRHEGAAIYSGFVEASGRKAHTTDQDIKNELVSDSMEEQADEFLRTEKRVTPKDPVQELKPTNREFGIVQHIQKLEKLNMRRSGVPVVIMKPKKQGTLSNEGIDQDTDQELNVFGNTRYGQKYEGGFEEPIQTYMLGLSPRPDAVMPAQGGEGEKDLYLYKVRMLGEPQIKLDDIVTDITNDFRYAVNKVSNFQFRGDKSVLSEVDLILLPRTNVVYEYSIDYNQLTV